ncbi:MAG: MFS transporter [Candidatus Bathyarchaeia archaeon]
MASNTTMDDGTPILLYFTGFMATASLQVIAPVIPIYFREELGVPLGLVGLLVPLLFLSSAAGKILITFYLREGGVPNALLTGCILMASSPILYLFAGSPLQAGLVRILHGLGFSLFSTAGLSLASFTSSRDRDRSIGLYTLALSLGLMVGPGIGSLGLKFLGLRSAFLLASAASLTASISSAAVKMSMREARGGGDADPGDSKVSSEALYKVVRDRGFQAAFLCYLGFSIYYGAVIAYAPIYLRMGYGFEASLVSLVFLLYFLMAAVGRAIIPGILSVFRPPGVLLLGLINVVVTSSLLYVVKGSLAASACLILAGLSHGVIFPSAAVIVSHEADSSAILPAANAVYLMGFDVGTTIGPVMVSGIASSISVQAAILASAAPSMLLIPFLASYSRRRPMEKEKEKGINQDS